MFTYLVLIKYNKTKGTYKCLLTHITSIIYDISKHCFQNRTEPGGRTVKTGNRDENRFFKPKEPDFLLIP